MSEMVYSVARAAQRLGVHPKTVLRFVHEGRLAARRIGKSWRILASDLDAFAGVPVAPAAGPAPARVTAIADLYDIGVDVSQRMATALQSMVMGRRDGAAPIKLDTVYDPERSHLKVIIVADALDAAAVLKSLDAFAEAFR
jgi:excisionase family DNA binding protein